MNESLIAAGAVLLIFLVAGGWIAQENKNRKKRFLKRLADAWGSFREREYSWEELQHISQFFYKREKKGFYIDDITWNDLDMDRVFVQMNQAVSSVGDEYLYDMLRKPVFEKEELEERNRVMEFFSEKEEVRHKVQALLADIRKPPNVSVYEAVHVTKDVELHGTKVQILQCAAFFLSLLCFILKPSVGVFFFLAAAVFNLVTYVSQKSEIEIYLTSFGCVLQLLNAQKKLEKLDAPELEQYIARGREYRKKLSGFRRGAGIVTERSAAGGGMDEMFRDYIRMLTHIDLIKFRDMMRSMQKNIREIEGMIELFGYLDAMISVASFRKALPYYTLPEFSEEGQAYLTAENLYHVLISQPVANSIDARRAVLVTGSNASGKSTFLKNIAVNSILAQTVYTCTAERCCMPFMKVMTSMALKDDLESGESYYIVEIRSLKRILDEAKKGGRLLCIIDEVLRGTNTIERIGASSRILARLSQENVLPFAATHDIELSYILEELYDNYHFEEEVREHDVVFNYLLKPGRVTTRNAIRLLEMIGYERELIDSANAAVREFETEGSWSKMKNCREL